MLTQEYVAFTDLTAVPARSVLQVYLPAIMRRLQQACGCRATPSIPWTATRLWCVRADVNDLRTEADRQN